MPTGPQESLEFEPQGEPEQRTESGRPVYSVEELNRRVRDLLIDSIGTVWVEGELSGIKYYRSGGRSRVYGTIKDAGAEARVVMWEEAVAALRFELEDGMKVLLLADVSLYPQRGQYQLVARQIRPAGVGELELAFQQLKEKLGKEGLFDEDRKQAVPDFPFFVGVVTSLQAAALKDFLNITRRRNRAIRVLIAPARVQGEGAAREIAAAVESLQQVAGMDCIVVTRGGGSLEDLWPFNEEVVARAVAACTVPVISAVGHETDWTICDMAADARVPTPSAAAERIAWSRDEWHEWIVEQALRVRRATTARLEGLEERVAWFGRAHGFRNMRIRLREALQQIDEAVRRLPVGLRHRFQIAGGRLATAGSRLGTTIEAGLANRSGLLAQLSRTMNALGPLSVLERGYAIARRPDGGPIVRAATDLDQGDSLELYLREGMAAVRVEETGPGLDAGAATGDGRSAPPEDKE
jgi:exodeoxyribonuclease VII large subunit